MKLNTLLNKKISITTKIGIVLLLAMIVSQVVTALYSYYKMGAQVEAMVGERLERMATTGSLSINHSDFNDLKAFIKRKEKTTAEPESSKAISIVLQEIKRVNHLSSDIYIILNGADVSNADLDSMYIMTTGSSGKHQYLKTEINEYAQYVFENKVPTHSQINKTNSGTMLTAFAPIQETSGKVLGVLVIEYMADSDINSAKDSILYSILVSSEIGAILVLMLGSSLEGVIGKPIIKLGIAARRVQEGNLNTRVRIAQNDEIGILANSFNEMVAEIASNRVQLEDYSKSLEKKVEERTLELSQANNTISAMVNSLDQGFFLFDESGACLPIYSKACLTLLENDPAKLKVWEILKVPEEKGSKWVQVLYSGKLPFSQTSKLGPKLFPHSNGNRISLNYFPVLNEHKKLDKVVVVATDKTMEALAEQKAELQKSEVQLILKIAKNRQAFLRFIRETREYLKQISELCKNAKDKSEHVFVMRVIHTIKGLSASFSMVDLAKRCHNFETKLQMNQEVPLSNNLEDIKNISESLEKTVEAQKDLLGNDLDRNDRTVEVSTKTIQDLHKLLSDKGVSEEITTAFSRELICEPIEDYFKPYQDTVDAVANRASKQVAPLHFISGNIRVLPEPYIKLFNSFIHAFRNAVDHGVESPMEREQLGKSPEGHITVAFGLSEGVPLPYLTICVKDDGKGIDPARLRVKLKEKGILNVDKENDLEILQHVFDSGISTRETVSDLSGRGVGLDAIRTEAIALSGTAFVESELGKGTTLTVRVPYIDKIGLSAEDERVKVA